ncbi:ComGF family competence protein [Alteribacter lacisalsi]|nr:ComGF family competence protein [Alteribacter lacisalsi]
MTSAYTFRNRGEAGCTLIEVLLSFIVTMIIVSVLFTILHPFQKTQDTKETGRSREAELFFIQFTPYFRQSTEFTISSTEKTLYLRSDRSGQEEVSSFTLHNGRIIRYVNGQGYDIFLEKAGDVRFREEPAGIRISLTFPDGSFSERVFTHTAGKGQSREHE